MTETTTLSYFINVKNSLLQHDKGKKAHILQKISEEKAKSQKEKQKSKYFISIFFSKQFVIT